MGWRGFRFCISNKLQNDETLCLREALEHNGGFTCINGVGSSPVDLRWVRAGGHDLPPQRSWHSQVAQAQSGAELELIYPMSLAPKFLGSRAQRQGLQQFQSLLWTSPRACNGCLLCGCIFLPIPQEIGSPPPKKASVFVSLPVPERFFFPIKYMCSKSALGFFL